MSPDVFTVSWAVSDDCDRTTRQPELRAELTGVSELLELICASDQRQTEVAETPEVFRRCNRPRGAQRRRLAARSDAQRLTTNARSLCGRCDPQGRPRLFPFPTDLFGTEGARRFQHSTTRSYYFTCVLAPLYSNCHITIILGNILIIKYLPLRWSK